MFDFILGYIDKNSIIAKIYLKKKLKFNYM